MKWKEFLEIIFFDFYNYKLNCNEKSACPIAAGVPRSNVLYGCECTGKKTNYRHR